MKALVINQYGGPEELQIREISLPSPKPGEVLVRVHAAGINPVDFKMRNGSLKLITGRKFPRVLGNDIAGIVEQAGNRSPFRPGDRVYAMTTGGGYAEFVTVKEKSLCLIPENISMTEAAATPLASLTALQALRKGEGINAGDRILINGASGGVGSFAVQIAKAMGAYVTGVASSKNIEFVYSLGADQVIDYKTEDFTKSKNIYNKIFDAVAKTSFSRCSNILEKGGMFITTIPNKGLLFYKTFNFLRNKKAGFVLARPSGKDLMVISDLINKGNLSPRVQKTFPLKEGSMAHKMIESERVRGKIVLTVII